jgi:hypothetical protein
MRDLYAQLGDRAAWNRYMAELRSRTRLRRALTDEMTRAGLASPRITAGGQGRDDAQSVDPFRAR